MNQASYDTVTSGFMSNSFLKWSKLINFFDNFYTYNEDHRAPELKIIDSRRHLDRENALMKQS